MKGLVKGKMIKATVLYEILEENHEEYRHNCDVFKETWKGEINIVPFSIGMRFGDCTFLETRSQLFTVFDLSESNYIIITRIYKKEIPQIWLDELFKHVMITLCEYTEINDIQFGFPDHLRIEVISKSAIKMIQKENAPFLPDTRLNSSNLKNDIFIPSFQLVSDYFRTNMGSYYRYPKVINVESSAVCNISCKMCRFHAKNQEKWEPEIKFMPIELYTKMIKEICTFSERPSLFFCHRGEELLDPRIMEKFAIAKRNKLPISLNTNGILLDKDKALKLFELEIDSISLSIESSKEKTCNSIMINANYRKMVSNLKALIDIKNDESKTQIGVVMVNLDQNLNEIEENINFWLSLGADFVVNQNEVVENEGYHYARNRPYRIEKRYPCRNLFLNMIVNTDGSVQVCSVTKPGDKSASIGNLYEDSLIDIWRGDKLKKHRELSIEGKWDKIPYCRNCSGQMCNSMVLEKYSSNGVLVCRTPSSTIRQKNVN